MEKIDETVNAVRIDVFALPDLVPAGYRPEAAVFIDVLRATTTMTTALAAGAKKIIPIAEPQEVLRLKSLMTKTDPDHAATIVTGGERKGVRIEGFDFGNSPSSYTAETVGGKTILFSTTNGTRAILALEKSGEKPATGSDSRTTGENDNQAVSQGAENEGKSTANSEQGDKIRFKGGPSVRRHALTALLPAAKRTRGFLASFLNAEAVVCRLRTGNFRTIGIVCAGTDRNVTEEDNLLAGFLVSRLDRLNRLENEEAGHFGDDATKILLNVQAETVRYLWDSFAETTTPSDLEKKLGAELLASRGGQNVKRIGLTADIRSTARINSIDLVPEVRRGEIRPDTAFEES